MPVITAQAPLPTTDATGSASDPRQQNTQEASQVDASQGVTSQEDQLSPKFAALARKEKQLRAERNAIKAERAAYDAEKAQRAQESTLASRLKQDTLAVLAEQGISYDDLVNRVLSTNPPNPEDQKMQELRNEIQALKDAQEQGKKSFEEQQSQAYQQAVTQIRNDVKLLVNGNPDFDTIQATGSEEAVVALIEDTFNQSGQLLTNEEAAKEVEEYLVAEAYKMSQYKKVQQRLTTPPPAAQKLQSTKQAPQTIRTLTNAMNAPSQPLSAKDRRQRAIAAFQGKLK